LVSQLNRLLDSEATLTASALKQNNLSRHREILSEHRREVTRLKSQIQEARNRANLLSNVRNDIDAYHSSNPEAAEAEYMLDERRRIDNSHNVADSVLSQAYAVNESFGLQRETLASINRRITGAASQVPGLNSLIGRISAKKRRDGIIMGSFIAFCFLMFLYFMWERYYFEMHYSGRWMAGVPLMLYNYGYIMNIIQQRQRFLGFQIVDRQW
jgi:golgi SNAP receptor complex member 1